MADPQDDPEDDPVNTPGDEYRCYFMICPTPDEAPNGIVDVRPNPPPGGWGPMFFIKFGDGYWDKGGRYTTNNPSFEPGHTETCVNIVGGAKYYLDRYTNNNPVYVNPGTYLKNKVLVARNFAQYIPPKGEWYRIHPGPGGMTQLIADLKWISSKMNNATIDFGFRAADEASNNGQPLQAQQAAATAALRAIAVDGYYLPNGAHVRGFLQRLKDHGHY